METSVAKPQPNMKEELARMVHHLGSMLRTVRRLNPNGASGVCAAALDKHLAGLTPEALGLPADWADHAARIEALAAAEVDAEAHETAHARSA